MFTPALRRLKELYPGAVVTLVTKRLNTEVVNGLPYIDNVYDVDGPLGDFGLLPVLWKQDYCVLTTWQPQLIRIAWALKIPHRSSRYKAKYEGSGLAHYWIRSWVLDTEEFAADIIARELGQSLGVKLDIRPQCDVVRPNGAAVKQVDAFLVKLKKWGFSKYVVIAPFTSRPTRDMPLQLLVETVKFLRDKYNTASVIIGPKVDISMMIAAEEPGVLNLLGRTSLSVVTALMEKAAFVVAPDSGPMHIAGALRKKTVSLFTRGIPQMWAPKDYCRPVTLGLDCAPCGNEVDDDCPRQHACTRVDFSMLKDALVWAVNKE